ncbi:glucose 1-dehydrogenase [Hyphococcus sp. DH-69]|uniref:glucose 1-dehydrogenase n=1 Tax=Hyphococcus formosus TaxID=3143534 RepID=UPI00398AC847
MQLDGKIAIVTGGASGFGAGIVRRFVNENARVVIADLNGDAAKELADELGEQAVGIEADVSDGSSVAALVREAEKTFGTVNVLVNNAGIGHIPETMETLPEKMFDKIFQVNMKSVYLTARNLIPQMKKIGGGAILNVASTGGVSPRPNLTWYNASKGWMITATKAMAIELAAVGIRVNAISPVAGDTPLLKTFMGGDTPEIKAKFLASIPIGRFSTPEDMGAAASFLCSDDASMITGVALEVDGGRCI